MKLYYDILRVSQNTSQAIIKDAYLSLKARITDPDLLIKIDEAYSILGDPELRVNYDNEMNEMLIASQTEEERIRQEKIKIQEEIRAEAAMRRREEMRRQEEIRAEEERIRSEEIQRHQEIRAEEWRIRREEMQRQQEIRAEEQAEEERIRREEMQRQQATRTMSYKSLLSKYVGQNIGINVYDPTETNLCMLIDVQNDYFSVEVKSGSVIAHIPYSQILRVLTSKNDTGLRSGGLLLGITSNVFIEIFHMVVYKEGGGVGFGMAVPMGC